MGDLSIHTTVIIMRVVLLLLVVAAFASAEKSLYEESAPSMEGTEENLLSVVKELRQATAGTRHEPAALRIEDHANLIQKAKAYKHSFGARNALRAAIRALVSELNSGHNHDRNALNNIKRRKVCNLNTSWFDMNIKGAALKFGGEIRNKWDRARADYLRKLSKYNAAVRAYNKAAREHAGAMSAFKATVKAEASNAHAA